MGQSFYVNTATGSDLNIGSHDLPFATLSKLFATAKTGDTGIIQVYAPGIAEAALTCSVGLTIIWLAGAYIHPGTGLTQFFLDFTKPTIIEGMELSTTGTSSAIRASHDMTLKHVKLDAWRINSTLTGNEKILIEDSDIGDYSGSTVSFALFTVKNSTLGGTAWGAVGAKVQIFNHVRFSGNYDIQAPAGTKVIFDICIFDGTSGSLNGDTLYDIEWINCIVRGSLFPGVFSTGLSLVKGCTVASISGTNSGRAWIVDTHCLGAAGLGELSNVYISGCTIGGNVTTEFTSAITIVKTAIRGTIDLDGSTNLFMDDVVHNGILNLGGATTPKIGPLVRDWDDAGIDSIVQTNNDKTGYSISGIKTTLDALNDLSVANINSEVSDVLKTDTIAELSAGSPDVTPTFEKAIMLLYMALRNKNTASGTLNQIFNNAGTPITKATISGGATITRENFVAP